MPASSAVIPRPPDEEERLAALIRTGILDTEAEAEFDFLTRLAAELTGSPYAVVTLVDEDRVWIKSIHGRQTRGERPRDDDYCSWVILDPAGFHVPDLTADPRTANMTPTLASERFRMYCGAPLVDSNGHRLGALCVLDVVPRELTPTQRELLRGLARQAMALIELRAKRDQLEETVQRLEQVAATDPLTGLANRRTLMSRLWEEVERSKRFGTPLSIVMFDLDHFKDANDRYGHEFGDAVLVAAAELLFDSVRSVDLAARYGGEEFCVVLPGTAAEGAKTWAEHFRQRLAATEHFAGTEIRQVTASFGVATAEVMTLEAEMLLREADRALYRAKQLGRNRVEVAVPPPSHG